MRDVPDPVFEAIARNSELFDSEVIGKRRFDILDEIYAPDARLLPPGLEMIQGREEIKDYWRASIDKDGLQGAVLSTVHTEMLGDCVLEIGRAELRFLGGQTAAMKYVVLWAPEGERWKCRLDIWNAA